ncbi:MAG: leucine-rich repeat domain-containing protein, partial [Acetatifactor sp.]|nr:leucine-rich repeat domain-containing protein [Acetatifactor sp.]
ICLISAILIATIPVEGLKQVAAVDPVSYSKLDEDDVEKWAKDLNSSNVIPDLLTNYTGGKIYNSGNGFQFAYASPSGMATGDDRVAVIVGFSENSAQLSGTLVNGVLTIPKTLDAYLNYATTDGSYSFVAVSKDGKYLFYEQSPEETITTSDGDVVIPAVYQPCYYSDFAKWGGLDDDDLYYYDTDDSKPNGVAKPIRVGDTTGSGANKDNKMRIKNAQVRYIGNHYAELDGTTGDYVIKGKTDSTNRIFGNISNVNTLSIDADLYGIGNYAFYGCGSLRAITLNSLLGYIGNYAFAGCNNMTTATLHPDMRLDVIGAHAFENCQALAAITVPHNVKIIGDAAFKGCAGDVSGLKTIDLRGGGNPSLRYLGCDLFVGCNKLESVTFPGSLEENVDISNFEGCLSLQYIAVSSKGTDITEGFKPTFGYEEFRTQYQQSAAVHGTFYFEGPSREDNPSVLHETARDHYFAFSYLSEGTLEKENIYELTVEAGPNQKATYRVNNANVLTSTKLDDRITTINLPEYIGPYYIATIGSGVFQNQCCLQQLTIPATVQAIEADAFSGCHQLEYVLFEDPTNLRIADGAFQTQKVNHQNWCDSPNLPREPKLTFVGPVSTAAEPFRYAMSSANRISVGDQQETYITYFSGWPNCLTVQHNPKTGKNELTDYLTLKDLLEPSGSVVNTVYSHIDSEMNDKYLEAMSGAHTKFTANDNPGNTTTYEEEIWDAVMNITLPYGIDGIQAGLFKTKEVDSGEAASSYFTVDGAAHYKTLTAYGLKEVAGDDDPNDDEDTGCFANCITFGRIELYGDTETIGDYAFKGCTRLQNVTLPTTVTQMGKIPFTGCEKLSYVNFQGSEYFTCDNSIIYRLDTAGNKYAIVEYLEGRASSSVTATEVSGVKEIAEEAFANTKVAFVDLSSTEIARVPERAFADCEKLIQVILPNSVRSVESGAFTGCVNIQRLTVPNLNTVFRTDAVD